MRKCFSASLALLLLLLGCGGDMDENMPCSFCVPICDGKEYDPAKEYCSDETIKKYGSVKYQNRTYKTVEIGSVVWMAENLNVPVTADGDSIKCYSYDCNKYGRLYDWATAMQLPTECDTILSTSGDARCKLDTPHKGICPTGWHVSRFYEWAELMNFVDTSFAGKNLKATKGWNSYDGRSGNGYDMYGFAALPGGYGWQIITPDRFAPEFADYGLLNVVGYIGYWWITEDVTGGAADSAFYSYMVSGSDKVFVDRRNKSYSHHVRCVKDPS